MSMNNESSHHLFLLPVAITKWRDDEPFKKTSEKDLVAHA
jgi:hypothetical protein